VSETYAFVGRNPVTRTVWSSARHPIAHATELARVNRWRFGIVREKARYSAHLRARLTR
jgi:hypothetical protein